MFYACFKLNQVIEKVVIYGFIDFKNIIIVSDCIHYLHECYLRTFAGDRCEFLDPCVVNPCPVGLNCIPLPLEEFRCENGTSLP